MANMPRFLFSLFPVLGQSFQFFKAPQKILFF